MPKEQGFTLIELIIVVSIIAILAAIAYPAYMDQIIHSGRSDGQTGLMNMAALMESYYTENNSYTGATTTTLGLTSALSPQGYYTLSISALTATSYTLTATPVKGTQQANDTICPTLTITNTNLKGPTATCWE